MTTDRCDVGQVKRIDVLPDEVLFEIFDFYTIMYIPYRVSTHGNRWFMCANDGEALFLNHDVV